MMDAAKWLSARKLRSRFSYRTSNLRNRLNQLCATSTTQRLAFFSVTRLRSLTSCLRPLTWGCSHAPQLLSARVFLYILRQHTSACAA